MVNHAWDLLERNAELLQRESSRRISRDGRTYRPSELALVGSSEHLVVDPRARVEPHVVADTTEGPVIIDGEAVVQAFSRLQGPCYIGPKSWILGANIRASTIGPACRVGGEVEASIIQGYSNKYHDGFLGHSYVGEWVNLGAGTQVSDLRHDYGSIGVTIGGQRIDTGLTKLGAFVGDHTKTGLNTLLNTGTTVGAFCQLLPCGELLPRTIPSFCRCSQGEIFALPDLHRLLATAAIVMRRRDCSWTPAHTSFFRLLQQQTAPGRDQVMQESERWRMRRGA
jgi:UDP-N-acetylglucosamine diphosphorylase/glucosamine-1-phosphate N-acetyltransferase